jgi:hypothetical protein
MKECHWSHACSLEANMRGIQLHHRVQNPVEKRTPDLNWFPLLPQLGKLMIDHSGSELPLRCCDVISAVAEFMVSCLQCVVIKTLQCCGVTSAATESMVSCLQCASADTFSVAIQFTVSTGARDVHPKRHAISLNRTHARASRQQACEPMSSWSANFCCKTSIGPVPSWSPSGCCCASDSAGGHCSLTVFRFGLCAKRKGVREWVLVCVRE